MSDKITYVLKTDMKLGEGEQGQQQKKEINNKKSTFSCYLVLTNSDSSCKASEVLRTKEVI